MGGWRGIRLIAIGVLLAGACFSPASARASADPDYWKQTEGSRDAVYSFLYLQSSQVVPAEYDAVRPTAETLRRQQGAFPAVALHVQELWEQIRNVLTRSYLLPRLRDLRNIDLAAGVHELLWKVGDGSTAKLVRIELPEPPAGGVRYRLNWHDGGKIYSNLLPAPPSWVVSWDDDDPATSGGLGFSDTPETCSGPPPGFGTRYGHDPAYGLWDCTFPPEPPSNNQFGLWLDENDFGASVPIVDYIGQPYDRATPGAAPADRATVEQAILAELDKPENAVLRDWLNYMLGSPGQLDPTAAPSGPGGPGQPGPGSGSPPDPSPQPPATTFDALAQRFAPNMRFDSSEPWRPLEIQSQFALDQPLLCYPCGHIASPADLARVAGDQAILDWPGHQESPSSYSSPIASCRVGGLRDCDSGPGTRIYYHVADDPIGYRYIDYWAYYRFNDAPGKDYYWDQHEGDWEGVSVAVSKGDPAPQTFDFVTFAAHKGVFRYLRDALTCFDRACGQQAKRVDVFVANGTHASYPHPCRRLVYNCFQTGSPLPEKGFDGRRWWGENDNVQAVVAFPPTGTGTWVDWAGNWNSEPQPRVSSPGRQARFQKPWDYQCSGRFSPETAGDCWLASIPRSAARAAAGAADDACAPWFGPFIGAVACDPAQLAAALRSGGLGRPGTVRIAGLGASAPGLAQAVRAPLRPGEHLTISGRAGSDARLLVRAAAGRDLVWVEFSDLGLHGGGSAVVRATIERGVPIVTLTQPSGRTVRPAAVYRQSTRRPARPGALHAVKRGRRIAIRFVARERFTVLILRRSRTGAPLRTQTLRTRPGRTSRVTVASRAGSRFAVVTSLAASGLASSAVAARIALH